VKEKTQEALVIPDDDEKPVFVAEEEYALVQERVGPSALRVLRGIGGIGAIWAGGWSIMGLAFGFVLSVVLGFPMTLVIPTMLSWGITGFLTGAGFATILTTMERKNLLEELSVPRAGVWGAVGGFAVSLLVLLVAGVLPFLGVGLALVEGAKAGLLGALSAVGTTVIAKSAGDGSEPSRSSSDPSNSE